MYNKIKSVFFIPALLLLLTAGCKKGTFDINNTNPNVPSSVEPKYILSAALTNSGNIATGGNADFADYFMGYWAFSGDYIPNQPNLTYKINTDYFAGNWDGTYAVLENYKSIETYYAASAAAGANFLGMAKIMKAFHFQRLVDMYNSVPYSAALNGGSNNFPSYDDAQTIYKSMVSQLDSAVAIIKAATVTADNPGVYDVLFGGNMTKWTKFANTLKLKALMHQTQVSGGAAYIQSKLTGMTTADFIGASADATVNPGYNNGAGNQQNPTWNDIGYTTTGTATGNNSYYRACSYAVNFYKNTNDPRITLFYTPVSGGGVQGRAFGSTAGGTEHNSTISGIGGNTAGATQTSGLLKSPTQGSIILSSAESFFLQAEAVQRGYLTGTAPALYQSGVAESFRMLGVANSAAAAATYTAQPGDNTNITTSSNPIKTIIIQKWAANNTYDPLESWNDWRRLGIPSDLPISIYPGTTASHIPYRLLYPTSEYNYNSTNVPAQSSIDPITSKIFWMP